ncbi:MAG TPA: hypothetical protein VGR56_05480 [Nitrososphaerales archaeon]|nr:hypothetical protein [Nitrososphaerales archaeon]
MSKRVLAAVVLGILLFLFLVPVVPRPQPVCHPGQLCPALVHPKEYQSVTYALLDVGATYVTDGWYGWGTPPPQY